jgi:pimeloyl-ACP methyl ester carboxylesterase
MKNYILSLVLTSVLTHSAFAQSAKPVYVIVHGAWGGSWAFKKVDSQLTEAGAIVYRPSLTGQGERVHLADSNVGLATHIKDVVNMILYEDLHDVILVGHSYGGMVITGVADSVPGRIKKLVYLDAFLPENGESVLSIAGERAALFKSMAKNGFLDPSWVPRDKAPPTDVPQSVKTFTDTIQLANPARMKLPATYILTVAKGIDPAKDDFASQAERARKKGWPVWQLEADHNPQWSALEALVRILEKVRA